MKTTRQIIEHGFIDIRDNIDFGTHAAVLKLFGKNHKLFQRAFARHPHEEGVHIWFPIFGYDENNDWENSKRSDWEVVFERRKLDNEDYLNSLLDSPEKHKRILFAKEEHKGKRVYIFRGIYDLDPELSVTAKKAAYKRIGTTAKVYAEI